MSRIFWDTNLFIYLFEGRSPLFDRVVKLPGAMLERGDQLVTSALTLGEVLVKPVELGARH
jgi:predicted nucleic acid-binding protein